jgi:hypothetical protein
VVTLTRSRRGRCRAVMQAVTAYPPPIGFAGPSDGVRKCGDRETLKCKRICLRAFPALFCPTRYKKAVRDVAHVDRSGGDLYRTGRRDGRSGAAAAGLTVDGARRRGASKRHHVEGSAALAREVKPHRTFAKPPEPKPVKPPKPKPWQSSDRARYGGCRHCRKCHGTMMAGKHMSPRTLWLRGALTTVG